MKRYLQLLFFLYVLLHTPLSANALKDADSPYLLQHAKNPVHWMPWSKEAFAYAKRLKKPIFVSIGYATCHWCHVMAKESFENKAIAEKLNKYFVCMKVDREEMPHIDAKYQRIFKKLKERSGGWPLNVFMSTKGEVFYIDGYIPLHTTATKEGMDQLIERLGKLAANELDLKEAITGMQHAKKESIRGAQKETNKERTVDLLAHYDKEFGGFGNARKFPEVQKIRLLWELGYLYDNKALQDAYFQTLDAMALHGLYDHVEGGFFRYCVDPEWEIPHFEKMLYNQAALIPLYLHAYEERGKLLYRDVVIETIGMVAKHFMTKEGLFYAASDAQSEGKEGYYYTFTPQEIHDALAKNPQQEAIKEAMGFALYGNFEERVHLNFFGSSRPKGFERLQKDLQKIRKKRRFPFRDTKINTAWNAMMITALYKAAIIDPHYAKMAKKSLEALLKKHYKAAVLYHTSLPDRSPKYKALLEDYAFLIQALLAAYAYEYDPNRLLFAEYLFLEAKKLFFHKGIWYLNATKPWVVAGSDDKYYTAAQTQMLYNMVQLALLKNRRTLLKDVTNSVQEKEDSLHVARTPGMIRLELMLQRGMIVIKSSMENLQKDRFKLAKILYPYRVFKAEAITDYEACSLNLCFAKEKHIGDLIAKINSYKKDF